MTSTKDTPDQEKAALVKRERDKVMTASETTTEIDRLRDSVVRREQGPTILLGSGTYFEFDNPEAGEPTIEDIAYGLAYEGRFAGQCVTKDGKRVFYPVAQHCVLMSRWVAPKYAWQALMHELAEAIVGDMTAPLKQKIPNFRPVEKRIEAALMRRFGVVMTDPLVIKQADVRMLATEYRDLRKGGDREFIKTLGKPFGGFIVPWTPDTAAKLFLERYHELAPKFARFEASNPWQSMDTAPLDGTHVLISHLRADGIYATEQAAFIDGRWEAFSGPVERPVAWMPTIRLPEHLKASI